MRGQQYFYGVFLAVAFNIAAEVCISASHAQTNYAVGFSTEVIKVSNSSIQETTEVFCGPPYATVNASTVGTPPPYFILTSLSGIVDGGSASNEDAISAQVPTLALRRANSQWIPSSYVHSDTEYAYNTLVPVPNSSYASATLNTNGQITFSMSQSEFPTGALSGPAGGGSQGSEYLGPKTLAASFDINTGAFTQSGTQGKNLSIPGCYEDPNFATAVTYTAKVSGNETFSLAAHIPSNGVLFVVDPSLLNGNQLFPQYVQVDPSNVYKAPAASGLSADGASAVVVVFQSDSAAPVTFSLAAPSVSGAYGSLTAFDPSFLVNGPGAGQTSIQVNPISPCPNGACTFLAILWSPSAFPASSGNAIAPVPITITEAQAGTSTHVANSNATTIQLFPPPVVLVHGIWSNGQDWSPFAKWLGQNYATQMIFSADYGPYSSLAFSDPQVQAALTSEIRIAIVSAANQGIVARKVDVVAHSMGGLVTRYLMENGPQTPYASGDLPPNPIHKLVTVGTPNVGSALASALIANKDNKLQPLANPLTATLCPLITVGNCTLGTFFAAIGKPVAGGVASLQPASVGSQLSSSVEAHSAIIGQSPSPSCTEGILNSVIIVPFVSGGSVSGFLGSASDTIVSTTSQAVGALTSTGAPDEVTVNGVVHASLCVEPSETKDPAVWSQVLNSLKGIPLTGVVPADVDGTNRSHPQDATSSPAPSFDLTGYTQIPVSNVSILPQSNSVLTLGTPTSITATSPSKTLAEILIFQKVIAPTDFTLLYAAHAPFSATFIPARLGTVSLIFYAMFTDKTFASTTLNYTVTTNDSVQDVQIQNPPIASLKFPQTAIIDAIANYPSQTVDVTNSATYAARSKTSSVFAVGTNGTITTTGNGVEWLDVTYGGKTGSALVSVGTCTYTLSPADQITSFSGGSFTIQVTTQPGCSWVADSDSGWLTLSNSVGSGSGIIQAVASSNSSGSVRSGNVTVGSVSVAVTQAATACSYTVTPTTLTVPSSGGQGTLSVTTSCPTIASADQTWADAFAVGSGSVEYAIDPNTTAQQRTATLTVGTQRIQVTEGGALVPSIGISPTLLSFPNQTVGTVSQPLSATVSNGGTATMAISGIQVTGTNPTAFNLNNGCGTNLAVGASCNISVTFKPITNGSASGAVSITDNSAGSPHSITLTGLGVLTPDFSISANPTSLTISQGQTGSATVSVSPTGGYSQPVTLSCIGLPSGATCSFSPSVLTPSGTPSSSALTVHTTTPLLSLKSNPSSFGDRTSTILASLLGVGFLARRKRTLASILTVFVGGVLLLELSGCSSGVSPTVAGTSKGSYSISIEATDGSGLSHNVAINLTVN